MTTRLTVWLIFKGKNNTGGDRDIVSFFVFSDIQWQVGKGLKLRWKGGVILADKGTNKKTGKKTAVKRGRPKKKPAKVSKKEILTDQQEAFLYYLVYEGLTQRAAYRKAYPNCTQKDSYVDSRASSKK